MKVASIIAIVIGNFLLFGCTHGHTNKPGQTNCATVDPITDGDVHLLYGTCDFTPEQMRVLAKMLSRSRESTISCFSTAYGRYTEAYVATVRIQPRAFHGTVDGRLKDAEFQVGSRTMWLHPTRTEAGDWSMHDWAAELHNVWRIELYGISDVYNRDVPSSEVTSMAQQCVDMWE